MAFCKTIKKKYSPSIQERLPGDFEGYYLLKGKVMRRICSRKITSIEQGEIDLNAWLIAYESQLNQIRTSLFGEYMISNPRIGLGL